VRARCVGKRFFEVDDERGIMYYFRTRSAIEWEEPARHFLLSTLLCVEPCAQRLSRDGSVHTDAWTRLAGRRARSSWQGH